MLNKVILYYFVIMSEPWDGKFMALHAGLISLCSSLRYDVPCTMYCTLPYTTESTRIVAIIHSLLSIPDSLYL